MPTQFEFLQQNFAVLAEITLVEFMSVKSRVIRDKLSRAMISGELRKSFD